MKIKHLIMTLAGVLIALASCKKEDGDKVPAGLTVDKVSITAGTEGATEVIKVTSSAAWTVTVPAAAQGWLHVSPAKGGKGTTKVTVTVDPNQDPTTGRSRKARINFIAGIYAAGTSVSQEGVVPAGDGLTVETAFSASEAHAWVMANLESGKESSGRFFVKGKISKITAPFATATDKDGKPTYKATFYITDDGNEDKENDFEAYQVFYLGQRLWREGDDDIAVGDEVILNCKLKRFESTAENNGQYPYLYSLNGEKSGKASAPSIDGYEAKTIAEFIAAAKTDTYYKLSGIVSQFKLEGNPTQGYLDDGTGTVQIYGVDDMSLWSEVENDGTLTIAAKYKKYEKNGNVTHEAVDCLFGSFVKGESVVAEGDGSLENPFNAAGAIQCVKDNGDKTTDDAYYVKGKIANIRNPYDEEHGTAVFSISADGTMKTTFLCYSILYLENKAWKLGNTQIKLGDEVIVHSRLTVYDGTYETLSQKEPEYKGYLYSLNGKTAAEVAPVIVIEDFSQTADGFKANWTYNLLTATTEFDWTVSGPTGTNVSGKVTGTELDYKMSMTVGEEYTLTVTCGEATASKTLTAKSADTIVLTFPDDNSANNKKSTYKCEWEATKGGYSWNIVNFNNNSWGSNWTYIKTGWKTEPIVSTITTAKALSAAIKEVVVTYDKYDAAVAASTKLIVATDAAFTQGKQEITVAGSDVVTGEAGTVYKVPTPTANAYYKLEISCVKASANGGIQISELRYNY